MTLEATRGNFAGVDAGNGNMPANWTPKSFSTALTFWHDASSTFGSGAIVPSWTDLSGNGRHQIGHPGSEPLSISAGLNGRNIVRYQLSRAAFSQAVFTCPQPLHIFAVFKNPTNPFCMIWDGANPDTMGFLNNASGQELMHISGNSGPTLALNNNWKLIECFYNPLAYMYQNRTLYNSAALPAPAPGGFSIGGQGDYSFSSDVDMAEVFAVDCSALPNGVQGLPRYQARNYFLKKWGV